MEPASAGVWSVSWSFVLCVFGPEAGRVRQCVRLRRTVTTSPVRQARHSSLFTYACCPLCITHMRGTPSVIAICVCVCARARA